MKYTLGVGEKIFSPTPKMLCGSDTAKQKKNVSKSYILRYNIYIYVFLEENYEFLWLRSL